ncbi:6-phosphogluconolactonase [Aureibacillus halotolerans]|uniref:6-phosphogluconolactonase n=1 Tax=Aureibacillus halotolerans TaxID=1508390 RepID=A0A4R6U657_9BACI|nr:6-phosphogluconolactonase [Aureibacillus halotolerans]
MYSVELDTASAKLTAPVLVAELDNPTYVNLSTDGQVLYAVAKEGDSGGVAAYSVSSSGELTPLNKQIGGEGSPCHVSVNDARTQVVTANYHTGLVALYPVEADGSLGPVAATVQHKGSGPNSDRQEKAHAHYAGFTPDQRYVVAVDLGTDELITYDPLNNELNQVARFVFAPGSGPRHIAFHPDGKHAFVLTELSNEVVVLSYDAKTGVFEQEQAISTLPSDFFENSQGSAIHLSSDGAFVYAGNRGHDSIAVFSVDETSKKLSLVQRVSTEGHWPRDFVLDPTEGYVVAANQESDNVLVYKRDKDTGKLTALAGEQTVSAGVCVKFLSK